MRNDSDPLQQKSEQLTEALSTARSRSHSADGLLAVEACADGEIAIHLHDQALRLGGDELSRRLTALAAQALAQAREQVQSALAEFRSDPRIDAAVWNSREALDRPQPAQPQSAPAFRTKAEEELARRLEFEDAVRENQAFLRRSLGR
ncbi:hypothetical protein AB0N05_21320 [Nocardia sp. NPDC051030]|uniref:YbaB/EbfC family nucleoid-associated protein n=1 Tax=Nocardia sp. NPDC051030 TaxID=3155162 RepID=UPI00343BED4D